MKTWTYKHYKWNLYKVIWVAEHTENQEKLVVYTPLYHIEWYEDWSLFVRPYQMFLEKVEIDWVLIPRFEYVWK